MRVTGRAAVPETHCDTWDGDEGLLGHWGVLGFPPPSLLGSLCYGELTAEGDAKKKKKSGEICVKKCKLFRSIVAVIASRSPLQLLGSGAEDSPYRKEAKHCKGIWVNQEVKFGSIG